MLKNIVQVVPAPLVIWVTQWLDLFSLSVFTYPGWRIQAQNTAAALGVVAAIAIALTLKGARVSFLRRSAIFSLVIAVGILAACWYIWVRLGNAMSAQDAKWLQDVWEGLYILAMVLIVATISMGLLSIKRRKRNTALIVFTVIGLVLFFIVGYFLGSG
jgi:hypothetical protein